MATYISQLTWPIWTQIISAVFAAIAAFFWLLSGLARAPYRPGMDYNMSAPEFMKFYVGFEKQGRRNKYAALAACIAAAAQAVATWGQLPSGA
jgi:hypothetical protein